MRKLPLHAHSSQFDCPKCKKKVSHSCGCLGEDDSKYNMVKCCHTCGTLTKFIQKKILKPKTD